MTSVFCTVSAINCTEFFLQDGSDSITRTVPASTNHLLINFDNLMKYTAYRARIVAYNDRGVGIFSDFLTAQTYADRKCNLLSVGRGLVQLFFSLLHCLIELLVSPSTSM